MKILKHTPDFLDGNELTDDELVDLSHNETFMRGNELYRLWRFDSNGTPWFTRVGAIKASEPDDGTNELIAGVADEDDGPTSIEWIQEDGSVVEWIYDD